MIRSALALALSALMLGCQAPAPLSATLALGPDALEAASGAPLPAGTLTGFVGRWDGQAFVPAGQVTVSLDGRAVATTDAEGRYGFSGVPPGDHVVTAQMPDTEPYRAACRLGTVVGVPRINMALVGRPAGSEAWVAGVVSDPRGAAVPGAQLRVIDSLAGVNRLWRADGRGLFAGAIATAGKSGLVQLAAYGKTPGGIGVESAGIVTGTLEPQASLVVTASTDRAARPPRMRAYRDGAWLMLDGEGLPSERDELVVRMGDHSAIPAETASGGARVALPAEAGRSVSLELVGVPSVSVTVE